MENGSGSRYLASVFAVLAAIVVPLIVAGLAADPVERDARETLSAGQIVADTARIAAGVERLRELRFERTPRARIVTLSDLRRLYKRDLKKLDRRQNLEAQGEVLKLVGLLDPGDRLREIVSGTVELVAGAYDPRTQRLVVVDAEQLADPAIVEFILAHELTHALEDQRFGLRRLDRLQDDRLLAAQALVEGSATQLMTEYALRYQDLSDLLGAALDPDLAQSASTAGLPDFLEAQLLFSYSRGQAFVAQLVELGGDWDLVDIAYEGRLPLSSEQILHPDKYLVYERPSPLSLDAGAGLGAQWRKLDAGTIGEFDTIQLLKTGVSESRARAGAKGWGGGRYELWRRGPVSGCEDPCRSRELLAVAWRWDSTGEAREFAPLLPAYLERGLSAERGGPGLWLLDDGVAFVAEGSDSTLLVFAPSPSLARRVAGADSSSSQG